MIEVSHNLFVGTEQDETTIRGQTGWYVIHACKEPYHRRALGYSGRGAPKHHPEYLVARREGCLILNLVDANDVTYIPTEIIEAALTTINENISASKVLVHCNQGMSRSPAIALLYLGRFVDPFRQLDHDAAIQEFQKIYPAYAPARGIGEYVQRHWQDRNSCD